MGEFMQLIPFIHHTQLSIPDSVSYKSTLACHNRFYSYDLTTSGAGGRSVMLAILHSYLAAFFWDHIVSFPPSTAAIANTHKRCGKTRLPRSEADCIYVTQSFCFSIPSRRAVRKAKHPGPRQSIQVRERHLSIYKVTAGLFTAEHFGHLFENRRTFNFRRATPFPMPNNPDVI